MTKPISKLLIESQQYTDQIKHQLSTAVNKSEAILALEALVQKIIPLFEKNRTVKHFCTEKSLPSELAFQYASHYPVLRTFLSQLFPSIKLQKITQIFAKCNAGLGHRLTIRGDEPNLNWSYGTKMNCIGNDLWLWTTYARNFNYKIVFDDNSEQGWEIGPDHSQNGSGSQIIIPIFSHSSGSQEWEEVATLNSIYSTQALTNQFDANAPSSNQIDLINQIAISLFPDEAKSFVPIRRMEPKEYAQKCVLSHPSLFPFLVQLFPDLSRTIEGLIDLCLEEARKTDRLSSHLLSLCISLPLTTEAIETLLFKVEKTTAINESKKRFIYQEISDIFNPQNELTNYILNRQSVNPVLAFEIVKTGLLQPTLETQKILDLLSLFTLTKGWGCLPSSLKTQILEIDNPEDQRTSLKGCIMILEALERKGVTPEQFTFLVKNQFVGAYLNLSYSKLAIWIERMLEMEKNVENRSFVEEAFQTFRKNYSLDDSRTLPNYAVLSLHLLTACYLKGISKEVCEALFQQICTHFREESKNHLKDLELYLSVLDDILDTRSFPLIEKEFLLSKILKEPALMPCMRMIRAIMEVGLSLNHSLRKEILEMATFDEIFSALCRMDDRISLFDFLSSNRPLLSTATPKKRANFVKLDLDTAKITTEILDSDGFREDEARDLNYPQQKNQTIAKVQGSIAFCKKTCQYAAKIPAALSPFYIRAMQKINSAISLTLRAKRIGHVFSLAGMVKLPNGSLINLEGFNETFVIPMLRAMFSEFASEQKDLVCESLSNFVLTSFSNAVWHDNVSDNKIDEIHKLIHNPSYHYPVIVSSGWIWHSTQAIFYSDDEGDYLFYCNRGADCNEQPGISILKIEKKENITHEFLKRIASRLSVEKSEYTSLEKIKEELKATEIAHIRMKGQKVGNCIYANTKAAFFAVLWAGVSREEAQKKKEPTDLFNIDNKENAKRIYKEFSKFDKEAVLEDFLIDLESPDTDIHAAQEKENYLDCLSAIAGAVKKWVLFQRGKTEKISSDLLERALRLIYLRDWVVV